MTKKFRKVVERDTTSAKTFGVLGLLTGSLYFGHYLPPAFIEWYAALTILTISTAALCYFVLDRKEYFVEVKEA